MITKPTLLLDEKRCRENIETMFLKAKNSNVSFRPHFKTHQSLEIGSWFKEFSVDKITVSSLEMAAYFAKEWNDITVAFPVNILEIETINRLANSIQLNVLIESTESIDFLKNNLIHNVGFFIKIDVGTYRTGVSPKDIGLIDAILSIADHSELLNFKGFLAHAGHTYTCRSEEEIKTIYTESVSTLLALKNNYQSSYPNLIVSYGDTPSCSVVNDFSDLDEIRPGNFIFYDLVQHQIGSCSINQIAVALACPIVAIHAERNEIVVYGGGVHFSKDQMTDNQYGVFYGQIVEQRGDTWGSIIPDMYVKKLSQEHGIIAVPEHKIDDYEIGDLLIALPVHSCMTVDALRNYKTTTGKIIEKL